MDGDGDLLLGPASQEEPSLEPDDDLLIPLVLDDEVDGQGSRHRSLSSEPRSGTFGAWLLVDREDDPGHIKVIGLASMQWTIAPSVVDLDPPAIAAQVRAKPGIRESWGSEIQPVSHIHTGSRGALTG